MRQRISEEGQDGVKEESGNFMMGGDGGGGGGGEGVVRQVRLEKERGRGEHRKKGLRKAQGGSDAGGGQECRWGRGG